MRRKTASRRSRPSPRPDPVASAGGRFGPLHSVVMAGCVALAPLFPEQLYAATLVDPAMVSQALADLVAARYLVVSGGRLDINRAVF